MSTPIKVGVAGLGRIGMSVHRDCLKARPDKFTVVAACDLIESRRDAYADLFGCKTYADYYEMIRDPEIEVVDIATRSCDHYAHAKAALLAGKSVLVEKPFCRTYAEACELVDLGSQPAGPHIYVRHNRRFEPAFLHAREIIASGILGKVYEIKLARHGYQRRDDWQTLTSEGGGQLNNWGPHLIDHALQFLDYKVRDVWSDLKLTAAVGDAEDHLKIVFRGESGLLVDVEISGGVAIPAPVYAVYGTKGAMISNDEKTFILKYLDPKLKLKPRKAKKGTPLGFSSNNDLRWIEKEIPVKAPNGLVMASVWDFMYDEIRLGKKSPITVAQAAEVVKYTELARKKSGYYAS